MNASLSTDLLSNHEIESFIQEAAAAGDTKAVKRARQALKGNKAARADVAAMMADAAVNAADEFSL